MKKRKYCEYSPLSDCLLFYLFICLSVCLSDCLSFCLSICLSNNLSVCLLRQSLHQFVVLCTFLSFCLYIHLFIFMHAICQSVPLSQHPSRSLSFFSLSVQLYQSIYLSVCQYSFKLHTCPSVHLAVYPSLSVSTAFSYIPVHLFIWLPVRLFIWLSIHLFILLTVHLSRNCTLYDFLQVATKFVGNV
jgi:hypothetical protein